MSQQEEGWPLGLQPLNMRVGLPRNGDFSGSVSFNTLLTGSPTSSTDSSSSDLDTESTGSFFHDKSITLGSLIGGSNILELSRKSSRVRKVEVLRDKKSNKKPRTWLFSLCSRDTTDARSIVESSNINNPPSLGHFLAVERKAANGNRRNQSPTAATYGPEEFCFAHSIAEPNSLFINGHVAPPRVTPWHEEDDQTRRTGGLEHGSGNGVPLLFSCMCGQPS
ncbi:uncharacterized protein At3g17950 isoform X2 [Ricinus communis]|uniref:uncharacterized protein At3g17950 isoform X2 n=1 Tax=Ricinus communis TaxID=3988 RepID=UPI00201B30CB|nr:uncharacterized protein At3g17950 isoform X2 [Ricinus communis]